MTLTNDLLRPRMEINEIFFILQIYGNSGIFSAHDILRLMVTWFVANDNLDELIQWAKEHSTAQSGCSTTKKVAHVKLDPYKVNNVSYCSGQM